MKHRSNQFFLSALLFALGAVQVACGDPIEQKKQSGPVSVTVSLQPETPLIGDVITLAIEVQAEPDVEVLMPDFGEALNRFSIVDFAPRQSIDGNGRTIAKQTYRLDPPSSGPQVIPPILIEYVDRREGQQQAPDGLDAYEILTDRIEFEVASVIPDRATADLKPPMGELSPIEPMRRPAWPWLIGIAIVLLALIPLVIKWAQAWIRRKRRRSAFEVANSRLDRLLREPRRNEQQISRFYVQLSSIVRRYIEDRFEMRAPELTTEEFLTSIGESPDFSIEHQRLLREFLRQADLVKFAGATPGEDEIGRSIAIARQFLDETRENAPLIDEEAPNPENPVAHKADSKATSTGERESSLQEARHE